MDRSVNRIEHIMMLEENQGQSKVMPLEEAIGLYAKPKAKLYVTRDANASMLELVRQYKGKTADFTLITSVFDNYMIVLLHLGLIRKLVAGSCLHRYPIPHPIKLLQKAIGNNSIEFNGWSLCSLQQRLMAGAWGVSFMPTESLRGSDLARDNQAEFKVIEDPFRSGVSQGVVMALNPDIALVHGCVADPFGNTIQSPPFEESLWGPRASRGGVIVTVEKVVSPDFIRKHSHMVTLPGYLVKAVCEVPFGAHPEGMLCPGLEEECYGGDYDFTLEYQAACEEARNLDTWVEEWVLGCENHDEYLCKLGTERLQLLRVKVNRDAWRRDMGSWPEKVLKRPGYTSNEMMIAAAAQKIKEKMVGGGYKVLHAGVGVVALASWLAYYQLRAEGYEVYLSMGSGQFGHAPRPGDPSLGNVSVNQTCRMLPDSVTLYAFIVGGTNNLCLSVLGAGQIDKNGNINTSKVSGGVFLTGSGGANDSANAREVVVVCRQSKDRFVDTVPYITCPGDKVTTLVSDFGIFEKLGDRREFTMTGYLPDIGNSGTEDRIQQARANCGWNLQVAAEIVAVPPPSEDALELIRSFDPQGYYLK